MKIAVAKKKTSYLLANKKVAIFLTAAKLPTLSGKKESRGFKPRRVIC